MFAMEGMSVGRGSGEAGSRQLESLWF